MFHSWLFVFTFVQYLFLFFSFSGLSLLTLVMSLYICSAEGGMIVWIDLVIGLKVINEYLGRLLLSDMTAYRLSDLPVCNTNCFFSHILISTKLAADVTY